MSVGNEETVQNSITPHFKQIDLTGKTIIPGLIDAHGHVRSLGLESDVVDLNGIESMYETVERVRQRAQHTPLGQWIEGRGWNQDIWDTKVMPTHHLLSEAIPDHPVWLVRVDGHAGWANEYALDTAGITQSTQPPSGGLIITECGLPTGLFIDRAMSLIRDRMPALTIEQTKNLILDAQHKCLSVGLTQIHDAGIDATTLEAYSQLVREGSLKIRIYTMLSQDFFDSNTIAAIEKQRFTCRSVKIISDGALGSRGAALFAHYTDDPSQSGIMLLNEDEMQATVNRAFSSGFQVNIHAIGDKANHKSLNAIESALNLFGPRDHRSRIEHAQIVTLTDIPRFAELDVIASIQPSHCTSDMVMAESRLGVDRLNQAYPWRKFLDAGVRLASGSDFPVEDCNPLWGIYSALTRQTRNGHPVGGWYPKQRLTISEALRSFTTDAAYASFQELNLGKLSPQMIADMVVLDTDIMNTTPQNLLNTKILATIVDGEVVFSSDPGIPTT